MTTVAGKHRIVTNVVKNSTEKIKSQGNTAPVMYIKYFYLKNNVKPLEHLNVKSDMIRFLYWKGHYNGRNRSKEAREDKGGDLLAVDEEKRIDSGDTEEGKWLNFLMD